MKARKDQAIKTLKKAILAAPWRASYYRDLYYFLKNQTNV
jgi:hypothetical protein